MSQEMLPLIVGAGPVGLGAALLLRRGGTVTRVIDTAEQPSRWSKALAVNPRTLELLESTGVTEKMLKIGLRIHGVKFRVNGKVIGELSLDSLHHKYPFMLALSQATTERLLNEALEAAGGRVERSTTLVTCREDDAGVIAELNRSPAETRESLRFPWLLAADGAHSAARKALNIKFNGSSFEKPWYLADVPLATSLEEDFGHVFFSGDGRFIFMLRVVDAATNNAPGPKIWRVISNLPNPVEHISNSTLAGAPVWTSDFRIAHRINETLSTKHVYFAGDAAHIHSPMGARGMNLGLEDAWVFNQCVQSNQMQEYGRLRKGCDSAVVKQVEVLSRIIQGESFWTRLIRSAFPRLVTKVPFVQRKVMETVTGLDHSLDSLQREGPSKAQDQERSFAWKSGRKHAH